MHPTTPWLNEVELSGRFVTLTPMQLAHAPGLLEAASDGELWSIWFASVPSPDTVEAYCAAAVQDGETGRALPFVVVENGTGRLIGSTRFMNVTPEHRRIEIGHTWYAKSHQRTPANTECKLLLLTHAFEMLKTIAVEFRTHWHNRASREAILRLGARQDGVLRNHQIDRHGLLRDTVVFSITEQEWATVRHDLRGKLGA